MANIELNGVCLVNETIAQRQRVLRAAFLYGRVFQLIFFALQRGGQQMLAQTHFVKEGVAAQARLGQVRRRRSFVTVIRFVDRQTGTPSLSPLR